MSKRQPDESGPERARRSKRKFTQDITDILADDMTMLDSIEPGAILRPDAARRLTEPAPTSEPAPTAEPAAPSQGASTAEPAAPSPPEPAPSSEAAPGSKRSRPAPKRRKPAVVGPAKAAPSAARPRSQKAGRIRSRGAHFADAVTLLEVASPEEGGVREVALPGDRSQSPPSPARARRGWNHPVARWATYIVVVVALTFVFVFLIVDVLHWG